MSSKKIQIENCMLMQEITKLFDSGKESVTIVVRGYSMRPFLEHERDKVVLVPPRTPRVGDVVLAEISKKRYALHRVIKIEDEIYTMRGDGNQLCLKEQFTEKDIIGVAKAFIRKGKAVTTDSLKWKAYSFAWNLLRPARRILLAIHRRIIKYI